MRQTRTSARARPRGTRTPTRTAAAHPPQLRPHPVPAPQVAPPLVAEPRLAHEQRRHQGCGARGPSPPPHQPPAEVHGDRPKREEQVQGPRDRLVRPGQHREVSRSGRAEGSGRDGTSTSRARCPGTPVERQVPRLDPVVRPLDHRAVDRGAFRFWTGVASARSSHRLKTIGREHEDPRAPLVQSVRREHAEEVSPGSAITR